VKYPPSEPLMKTIIRSRFGAQHLGSAESELMESDQVGARQWSCFLHPHLSLFDEPVCSAIPISLLNSEQAASDSVLSPFS